MAWFTSLPSHTFQMSIHCGQATAVGKTAMDCTRDIKLFEKNPSEKRLSLAPVGTMGETGLCDR